jgi:3-deoxy-D-manno-octulosonic-acid transferase
VYLLYSLLLTLGFVALMPRFALDAMRNGKYVTGLRERLGKLSFVNSARKPLIWLHCVSVGETQAAQSLVHALRDRFPSHLLVISTTTVTGQQVARKRFAGDAALIFYFPIDVAWVVRRVLRSLQPAAVFIMETELWPRLLRECRTREIPVALLNGRISRKSFKRYKMIRPFMRRVLGDLTIGMMQSEQDAARIRELGLSEGRIACMGNLKFDSAENPIDDRVTSELRTRFRFDHTGLLIVAASTHAPEERIVIDAFKEVKRYQPERTVRLLIAPRHPERFSEVAALLEDSNMTWSRKSSPATEHDATCDVVLLDTIGELRSVYPLAELVLVGGSIAPHGGHNVLEPASAGACVITGPHTGNFAAVTKTMLKQGALIQLSEQSNSDVSAKLAGVIANLLSNETMRREIGDRARAVCRENAGATARTMKKLSSMLSSEITVADTTHQLSALQATTAK